MIAGELVDSSRHPDIFPRLSQIEEEGEEEGEAEVAVVVATVLVPSRQPNHPGS